MTTAAATTKTPRFTVISRFEERNMGRLLARNSERQYLLVRRHYVLDRGEIRHEMDSRHDALMTAMNLEASWLSYREDLRAGAEFD